MEAGRFVVVGDSFSEGVGDPHVLYPNGFRGWADRLARQLGRQDPRWEYANLAIRSKLLDEVVAEQLDPALALQPTHLSFHAGGNDILSLRTDMDSLMERYAAAVARAAEHVPVLVLFTIFDPRTTAMLEPLRRRLQAFNDAVRGLAESHGAILVDHALMREFEDPRLWAPDRIHLSRPGHKRVAAATLEALGWAHTLRIKELGDPERRPWRQAVLDEVSFVRGEVVPLVRRRIRGVREGDHTPPKWPVPIRPSKGMKRLASTHSGAALRRGSPARARG
ncbi:SGNH/GDSL hydrolase family protein [Intrasporangium calvum]|uniref:SGNH/GDSL hydrolase family protein n=1 Tax=Intrasporangium calvum TaxID=53358 RepID=A0ABT5GIB0_9MICO|nr:SGNH/GDSL hydrolase family protein [Intrasporangium calvum]MDC5697585.1 SGNH/GDSL hydrolase family protein [Intrasporangium calvum]